MTPNIYISEICRSP